MQAIEFKRPVVVNGMEYLIEVRRSAPRHVDRFGGRCYGIVELPNQWQATVPVPDCVRMVSQLWYRELIDMVQQARKLVSQRTQAA